MPHFMMIVLIPYINLLLPFLDKMYIFEEYGALKKKYRNNNSNIDDSFTLPDSNSFLSPYTSLTIALENKYEKCMLCVLIRIAS